MSSRILQVYSPAETLRSKPAAFRNGNRIHTIRSRSFIQSIESSCLWKRPGMNRILKWAAWFIWGHPIVPLIVYVLRKNLKFKYSTEKITLNLIFCNFFCLFSNHYFHSVYFKKILNEFIPRWRKLSGNQQKDAFLFSLLVLEFEMFFWIFSLYEYI